MKDNENNEKRRRKKEKIEKRKPKKYIKHKKICREIRSSHVGATIFRKHGVSDRTLPSAVQFVFKDV